MIDPASGPFLFDTSADSCLARTKAPAERAWIRSYLALFPLHVSAITVLERMRGYAVLLERTPPLRRAVIETARSEYLRALETETTRVLPFTTAGSLIAAQLVALSPTPPSPPRGSHQLAESRPERLHRWRLDILIAATALATGLPLIHTNPEDFEHLRCMIERFPRRFPGTGPLQLISVLRLAD
ncbi:MAG: PIN domain-containing protein [Acidobacteriota bacterium]